MDGTILLAMAQIHPQQQVFTALENQLLTPAGNIPNDRTPWSLMNPR
ncbi:MAG: hypothetical protein V3T61_05715 [Acidobacteriota bacterium]